MNTTARQLKADQPRTMEPQTMTAHVIAYARHRMITTAALLDLHRAHKLAKHVGDSRTAALFRTEINRRLEA